MANVCPTPWAAGTPAIPWIIDPDGFNKEVGYGEIVTSMLPEATHGRQWDAVASSPYFDFVNASTGKRHRVWYDDAESLALKSKLAVGYYIFH